MFQHCPLPGKHVIVLGATSVIQCYTVRRDKKKKAIAGQPEQKEVTFFWDVEHKLIIQVLCNVNIQVLCGELVKPNKSFIFDHLIQ